MLLLALFVAAVFGARSRIDDVKDAAHACIKKELGGPLQDDFEACKMQEKLSELESHGAGCNIGPNFVLLVTMNKQWYLHRGTDKSAGYVDLMKGVKEFFKQGKKNFFLTFQAGDAHNGPGAISNELKYMKTFQYEIRDDKDLEYAIDFSRVYKFSLKLKTEIIFNFKKPQMKSILSVADDRDTGIPTGRSITFTKLEDETDLKMTYYDVIRVIGSNKWCNWEIMINGKACPSGRIMGSLHTKVSEDDHIPGTIVGICKKVPKTAVGKTHTMSIMLTRKDAATNCYTGWYTTLRGNYVMEVEELIAGTHELQYVQEWKGDGTSNNEFVPSRLMTFNKVEETSYVRIFWKDNFRKYSPSVNGWCKWGLWIDGKISQSYSGANGGIGVHFHAHTHDNDHMPKGVVGYMKLPRGEHKITVKVERTHSSISCYLGWGGPAPDNWYMEVREVGRVGDRVQWRQWYNNGDGKDVGYVTNRYLTFDKMEDDTQMRLMYSDNLRVYRTSHRCRWEIRVDDASCKTGLIARSMHTADNDNDHQPAQVVGYCGDLKKGKHTAKIYVTNNNGKSGHDCYTGSYWGYPNSWVIEAEESRPVVKK